VMVNPFEIFSFYIPENQHTYENYQAANPLTDYEDIVWRVNARLYREAFYDATIHTDPNPLLVNPYHRLPDDFTPAVVICLALTIVMMVVAIIVFNRKQV